MRSTIAVLFSVMLSIGAFDSGAAAETPLGSATVTRAHGDGMAVWDATSVLTQLIAQKVPRDKIMRQLESDAATVLLDKIKTFRKNLRSMTVVVLYAKTGAISSTYNVATFEGVEKLLTMKASAGAQLGDGVPAELRAGRVPHGIELSITGELPPELR